MREKVLDMLILITLIISFLLLIIIKPPENPFIIKGRIKDIYYKNDNFYLRIQQCNYQEVRINRSLAYNLFKLKNHYVKLKVIKDKGGLILVNLSE